MQVHKFGGASVKDAHAIRNVAGIISGLESERIIAVMSAMDKTTNALETVVEAASFDSFKEKLAAVADFHLSVINELFPQGNEQLSSDIQKHCDEIAQACSSAEYTFHALYDEVVSRGELMATRIAAAYFQSTGMDCVLLDARRLIATDSRHREARVDWETSRSNIHQAIERDKQSRVFLVQGFIGSDGNSKSTTLGREGSDFSAAIFASSTEADSVTLWKDVPGVFSADPKSEDPSKLIPALNYYEALEMANYGAKVIHPKTLIPLENQHIKLNVRSFQHPEKTGTIITSLDESPEYPPIIVRVPELRLLSLQLNDLSYISAEQLHSLMDLFRSRRVKTFMLQPGFINLNAGISVHSKDWDVLLETLKQTYQVKWNSSLEMVTLRHYDESTLESICRGKTIFLEQRSRHTVQLLLG